MAILIDPKGMLEGKRLRKLSHMARLYYFQTLAMTNFYARLEMDADLIALKLAIIKDPNLTDNIIEGYFDEYVSAGLCMKYTADGAEWVQYDTPLKMRADFPTNEDNASPAPPEPAYTDWLQSLHGSKWQEYHMTGYRQSISEKRAAAGRAGGIQSGISRGNPEAKPKQNEAKPDLLPLLEANEPVEVGVDVGVDVEEVVEVNVANCTAIATPDKTTIDSTTLDSIAIQNQDPLAEVLAKEWFKLMEHNEYFDKKYLPRNGSLKFQAADFSRLLDIYEEQELREILAFSQSSDKQMQFNYRTKSVLDNHIVLCDKMKVLKKKPTIWNVWWKRYCLNSGYVPPAQTVQATFNIEDDEDDDACVSCEENPCVCRSESTSNAELDFLDDDDELA
jgi:hypothetical protein